MAGDDPRTVTTSPLPGFTDVNTLVVRSPDNAGGVHVGKDDLDVGTGDQAIRTASRI